jgi:hypothetical protein
LALKVDGNLFQHRGEIISITLMVVLMTSILLGNLMNALISLIGLSTGDTEKEEGRENKL